MTRIEILYLFPYLLSLFLSACITIYTWNHRRIQGAGAYLLLTSAQLMTIFGFIIELLSMDLAGKLYWDKFQWIIFAVWPLAILNFAVQYTDFKLPSPKILWSFLSLAPFAIIVLVFIDPWVHLLYPNPTLDHSSIFGELDYTLTWPSYSFAIYGYLVTLVAFVILGRRLIHPYRLFRAQILTVIIGLTIPIFGTALPLFGIKITQLRDATPITSVIGNLIIAWGIFQYRWLNILHIARDKIFERMPDFVFVLDAQNNLIDINPEAANFLNAAPVNIIGQPAIDVFREWTPLLEEFRKPTNSNIEVILKNGEDDYFHFDVQSTLLYDNIDRYQGRVFVARNITPYATLQRELQELNNDLEQRVETRTQELAEAYDTTLEGWAKALELRDKETEGHSRRVTELTIKLALALDVPKEKIEHIRRGAILHDIGKMAIPDEILRKPGPLTNKERAIVIEHPTIAKRLLSGIPFLKESLDIPYAHHEKWDGTGYPQGLKGEEIPLGARIFAIVDVWDAVQSKRPYKEPWPRKIAVDYLREQAGSHFDPSFTKVFLGMVENGGI